MRTANPQRTHANILLALLIAVAMPSCAMANDGGLQQPRASVAAADPVSELEEQTRNFLGPNAATDYKAEAHAIIQRGLAESAKGDTQAAEASFRTALYVDPSNADARFNLGVIAENKGDLSGALGYYQGALKTHPDDPELKDAVQAVQSRLKVSGGLAQSATGQRGFPDKSQFTTPESPFPQAAESSKLQENRGPFSNPESLSTQPSDWMKSPPPTPSYPPLGQNLAMPAASYSQQSNMTNRQQSRMTRHAVHRLLRIGRYFL